ncbi:hypothetical protein [Methanosphaera sp.]
MLEEFMPLMGLIIFGNIENLILASHGVVKGANPVKLGILSVLAVLMWLIIGTVGTSVAMPYANVIDFIGGLAIVILGVQSMVEALRFHEDPNYD